MSSPLAHVRRNAITRRDLPIVWGLAVAAGVGAAFAGCAPTGQPVFDAVLTGLVAVFTVWLGASASWWSLCAAGFLAALLAGTPLGAAGAVFTALIGMYLGNQRNFPWMARTATKVRRPRRTSRSPCRFRRTCMPLPPRQPPCQVSPPPDSAVRSQPAGPSCSPVPPSSRPALLTNRSAPRSRSLTLAPRSVMRRSVAGQEPRSPSPEPQPRPRHALFGQNVQRRLDA